MNIYISTWFLVEICFTERADDLELQILASRLQSSDGEQGGGWFNIHYPCVTLISRRSNAIPGVFIPGSLPFTLPKDSRSLLLWFSSSEVLLVLSDLNKDKLFHIKDQDKFTQAALVECWRHEERRFSANWAPCRFAEKLGPALFGAQFAISGRIGLDGWVDGSLGWIIEHRTVLITYWNHSSPIGWT